MPSWRDMGSVTSQSTLTDCKNPISNQQPSGRRIVAWPYKLQCHGPWPVLASRLVVCNAVGVHSVDTCRSGRGHCIVTNTEAPRGFPISIYSSFGWTHLMFPVSNLLMTQWLFGPIHWQWNKEAWMSEYICSKVSPSCARSRLWTRLKERYLNPEQKETDIPVVSND